MSTTPPVDTETRPAPGDDLPLPEPPSLLRAGLGGLVAVLVLIAIGALVWFLFLKPEAAAPPQDADTATLQPGPPGNIENAAGLRGGDVRLEVVDERGSSEIAGVTLASEVTVAQSGRGFVRQPHGCKYVNRRPKCIYTPLQASHSAVRFLIGTQFGNIRRGDVITVRIVNLATRGVAGEFSCRAPGSQTYTCSKVYYGPFPKTTYYVGVYYNGSLVRFDDPPTIRFF